MLRVITKHLGTSVRLELLGVLGGDWVQLLEEHWRAIVQATPTTPITVVLSEVDFVDRDGERLLQSMTKSGVRFIATGCMNRYVVEKLSAREGEVKGAQS